MNHLLRRLLLLSPLLLSSIAAASSSFAPHHSKLGNIKVLRLRRHRASFVTVASTSSTASSRSSRIVVAASSTEKDAGGVVTASTGSVTAATMPTAAKNPNDGNKGRKRLVLVGGGHAHLQVIKGLNRASRPRNLDVTLIDVTSEPVYSGMVPSAIAGIYAPSEPLIDLASLAEWSDIEFVQDRVVDVDVTERAVLTEGGLRLKFDAVSIDVGSTSRGWDSVPGARENAIPTRPIGELVRRLEEATADLPRARGNNDDDDGDDGDDEKEERKIRVAVVGGGAAGIELAMGALGRWKPLLASGGGDGDDASSNLISVTILTSLDRLLPDETSANRDALRRVLDERGIRVVPNATVRSVDPHFVVLASGDRVPYTHCLWATGASCHSDLADALRKRGVALSEKGGWIRVDDALRSVSHPFVFAAGDCCSMELPGGGRSPPKAGVYAVRAGPVLVENLVRCLTFEDGGDDDDPSSPPLRTYAPQRDFLKLLACGDGKALGFRFGIPLYGRWVFELKDAIDRSFVDLFRRENLPELVEGEGDERRSCDVSQYDASSDRPPPLPPGEAAALLRRTDDDVDFRRAWDGLRDMAEDDAYRDEVLRRMTSRDGTEL